MKIVLISFKNKCCCFSYSLSGSRRCFFSGTEKNIAGFCLRTLVCHLFLLVFPVWAGSWWFHWVKVQKRWPIKKMLSFDSANFSIHHLCIMGFGLIILKTACVKACTPRLIYFFAQLYYWVWLYTVVVIQNVLEGWNLHFQHLLSEGDWVFLSNPVTYFQKLKKAFLKKICWQITVCCH